MLPTNSGRAKDKGCNPVSSNCVVWQGPDLGCIGVCKGDTISDVLANTAEELCILVDMFDLSNFDFSCLAIPNSEIPVDAGDLIQILIERVCALEGIDPTTGTTTTSGDCPDSCIVPIADCFYYTNPQGDIITTMTLTEYVTAIGNRVCDLVNDIVSLQNQVETLQLQINGTATSPGARKAPTSEGLVGDVEALEEDKADKTSLEYQVNTKTDPSAGIQYITDALRSVEDNTLRYFDASGTPTSLYQNMLKAGLIDDEAKLFGTGTMSTISGWNTNAQTSAESLGNLWLSVLDLRSAVEYMQENCCSTGCSDIWLNFRATVSIGASTILTIFTDGSTGFTPDWKECNNVTQVTVTDAAGNSSTFSTSLIAIMDDPSGYSIDITGTSIDPTLDLTVSPDTCFTNTATEATCEKCYEYVILAAADCPATILTVYTTSVSYQFSATAGYSYIVNVYYNGGSTPVASQIIATPGVTVINTIFGLLSETDYELEVIVVDAAGGETPCARQAFTTLASDCQPPINASAMLTI